MTLRGLGMPRTDIERVMAHYGIDQEEAAQWLQIHPVSELLPERGAGLAIGNINSVETLLQGIGVAAFPGERITVAPGDIVRVRASVDYMGPRLDDTFYAAIGNRFIVFDEIWVGGSPISFALSYDFVTYPLTVDIPITAIGVAPWTPGLFDLYVKLVNNPGAGMPELSNVIEVLVRAQFENFAITGYEKV